MKPASASVSLLPLVARIRARRPDLTVLVTSGTRTSAELLAKRLPAGAIHQYAPVDAPAAVARPVRWRPGLGLFAESELWPNLNPERQLTAACSLGLISARMTEASAQGWARRPAAARAMLSGFTAILAPGRRLGGAVSGAWRPRHRPAEPETLGAPLEVDATQVAELKGAFGVLAAILAASTHPGEETLIADAVGSRRAVRC